MTETNITNDEFTSTYTFGDIQKAIFLAKDYDTFVRSGNAKRLQADLENRLADIDVLSLDVFDTLLIRNKKSELERFYEVALRFTNSIDISVLPESTLLARIYSASTAYKMGKAEQGCIEGKLTDIALNTVKSLKLDKAFADAWISAELETEINQLKLSPIVTKLIEMATSQDKKVILVSDMYLESELISQILKGLKFDVTKCDDIISSADKILNKRSGTIFPALEHELDVPGERFFHIGDSLRSDYQMPKKHGWLAMHIPVPHAVQEARGESHRRLVKKLFGTDTIHLPMAAPSVELTNTLGTQE